MKDMEQYLRNGTGTDWKEISLLYADFKKYTGFPQFCVLTADDPIRSLRPQFYIPSDGQDVHNPGCFIDRVNAKNMLVDNMPWVQIDLDDLPPLTTILKVTDFTATVSIALSGNIKFRKLGSINSQTISKSVFTSIGTEAKSAFSNILGEESANANLDLFKNTFTFGTQLIGGNATVNINIGLEPNGDSSITGELIPTHVSKIIKGWQVEGEFGYKVVGEMTQNKTPPTPPMTVPATDSRKSVMIIAADATPIIARALLRVATRVIFVLGEAALAAVLL